MANCVTDGLKAASIRFKQAGIDSHLLDAQLLMAYVLNVPRLSTIAHPERELSDAELAKFAQLVEKRAQRFPLAYILGHREFYGLEMTVAPGVLVPRPETELLVEETVKRLSGRNDAIIADIGVGTGAIAIAIALSMPSAKVFTTEISPDALKTARANIERHHMEDRVILLEGDVVAPIAELGVKFDAIVSNPPYIPSADIETLEPEVKDYEPRLALDGGPDGLDVYRCLFPESIGLLSDEGFVAVEIGQGEAVDVSEIATGAGFVRVEVVPDLAGIERVVIAHK